MCFHRGLVVCSSTKAAISLKRVKIGEQLLYGGPIGTNQRSLNGTIPDPLRPLLPQDWGSQPTTQNPIAVRPISGTSAETDFKFGRHIHTVRPKIKAH